MPFQTIPPFPTHASEYNSAAVKNALNNIVTGYNSLQNLFNINGGTISNGILVRTGVDANNNATFSSVTLTAGSNITITNGSGVSGNPTIAFSGYPTGVNLSYPATLPLEATGAFVGAPLTTFYKTNNQSVTGTNTTLATITIPSDLLQNGDGVVLKAKCATGAGGGTITLQMGGTTVFAGTIGTSVTAIIEGETVLTSAGGAFTSIVCSTTSSTTTPSNLSRSTGTLASGLAATSIVIQTTGTFTLDMLTLIYNRGGNL